MKKVRSENSTIFHSNEKMYSPTHQSLMGYYFLGWTVSIQKHIRYSASPRDAAMYCPITHNMVFILGITAEGFSSDVHGDMED